MFRPSPPTPHLANLPYENSFYFGWHVVDAQAVVTSPRLDSSLAIIGPRLTMAWPAGNSSVGAFFRPQNSANTGLGIEHVSSAVGSSLASNLDMPSWSGSTPVVGVSGG